MTGSAITADRDTRIRTSVAAKNVYVVGDSPDPTKVSVSFNGQQISTATAAGADVTNSQVTIQLSNLYRIAGSKNFTSSIIELRVPSGVTLNTSTFGN